MSLKSVAAFLLSATLASAQSAIQISSSGTYNGQYLTSTHVGAAQSYEIASSSADASYSYNSSAGYLQATNVGTGYTFPCYVYPSTTVSSNAGVLECGATGSGAYSTASVSSSGVISIGSIASWWVCTALSTGYGNITGTIVGAYGSDMPSGAGLSNCVALTALTLGSNSTMPTYSNTTATTTATADCGCMTMTMTTSACDTCAASTYVTTVPTAAGATGTAAATTYSAYTGTASQTIFDFGTVLIAFLSLALF